MALSETYVDPMKSGGKITDPYADLMEGNIKRVYVDPLTMKSTMVYQIPSLRLEDKVTCPFCKWQGAVSETKRTIQHQIRDGVLTLTDGQVHIVCRKCNTAITTGKIEY